MAAAQLLALEAATSEPIGRLREEFRARLSGVYTTSAPDYRIIVRLTGSDAVPDRRISAAGQQVTVEFQTGAAATLAQQTADLQTNLPALKRLLPTLQGAGSDEATGEIVLHVLASHDQKGAIVEKKGEIARLLRHAVRLEFTAVPGSNL